MMSCGEILFSCPGFVVGAPQRPQFFKRSPEASWISWSVTLSVVFVMGLNPLWRVLNHTHKLIDYHGRKFQPFAFIRFYVKFSLSRISHDVAPASLPAIFNFRSL